MEGRLPAGHDVRGTEIVCRFTDAEGLRDLVNAAGLPASPFRTDTWPIEAAPATKR